MPSSAKSGKSARKFLFDTGFLDDSTKKVEPKPEDLAPPEPEPPLPPTFSEEELEQARSAGFTEGRTQGLIEAQASIERQTAMALERMTQGFQDLFAQHHRFREDIGRDAAQLSHTIARKICPELAQRNALVEIEALTRQAVEYLTDEPRVFVRMNQSSMQALGERLEAVMRSAAFEGQVLLRTENSLCDGDCRIEWANGGAERLTDQLWRQVDDMVAHFLKGEPPAETDTPIPESAEASATAARPSSNFDTSSPATTAAEPAQGA